MSRKRLRSVVAVLVAAVALASCSDSGGRGNAPTSTSTAARRDVLVSIGSSATFGDGLDDPLRDSWPQRLYHDAFPRSTVFVNASDRSLTVKRALGQPLSIALEVHATVVVIWLGDLELDAAVEPARFATDLDTLVARLRDSGARVFLGNLARSQLGADAYDDAIARVARTRGATLVDLATVLSTEADTGPSADIDAATSRTIANAFAAALTRS